MLPSGHHVSAERLEEFCCIYKRVYDKELTVAEAREMTHRLLALYNLLRRPLPHRKSDQWRSGQSPAQTDREAT
jgi:hypothetical protein